MTLLSRSVSFASDPVDGQINYRYWLAVNRHEYKKQIAFFNATNMSTAIKGVTKISLPKIMLDQEIYVPMLAKIFDLKESA